MAIPGSEIYGWRKNDALNAWNEAKLRIQRRRGNVLQQYGYTADYDETGKMTNMRIDPTSQYGRFQQMMRGHSQTLDRVQDAQIERGLGAGSLGLGAQQESEARYHQGGEQAALGQELSGSLAELSEAQADEERQYNRSVAGIDADAARAAWEDEQFTPAEQAPADEGVDEELDWDELMKSLLPRAKAAAKKIAAKPKPKSKKKPAMGVRKAR